VLPAVTSVSEVLFLQLILFANTVVFFCSLLGPRISLTLFEVTAVTALASDDVASKRSITHAILDLFSETMAHKSAFQFSCLLRHRGQFRDNFFFFLRKDYIPQYYRRLTS